MREGSAGPGKNRKKLIFEGMNEAFHRKPRPLWDCSSLLVAESTPETWQRTGPGWCWDPSYHLSTSAVPSQVCPFPEVLPFCLVRREFAQDICSLQGLMGDGWLHIATAQITSSNFRSRSSSELVHLLTG